MAYATIAQATAYLTARGLDASGVTDALLLRGSDYIDQAYGLRFVGTPVSNDAAWPRTDAVDIHGRTVTGIPTAVQNASIEAAYRMGQGNELLPDYTAGQAVAEEKVGPIDVKYAVDSGTATDDATHVPTVPVIDRMLAFLLVQACVPVMLVR